MNHLSKIPLATLVALASSGAVAQESVNLSVTGTVVPSSCVPTLSSAAIDWGTISISGESDIVLPAKDFKMQIDCSFPTRFALEVSDNKTGTLPNKFPFTDANFGYRSFDLADGDVPVGGYALKVRGDRVGSDGAELRVLASQDDGATWAARSAIGAGVPLLSAGLTGFGDLVSGSYTPVAVTQVVFDGYVEGLIRPQDLPQTNDYQISGSSTFTIKYL
ncbi:DUF1120 domain-containing protein [Pseudoxanthomonas sp. UTMC 1351]|uniref:DUF1120 domain-containing protein n=1 Tax=Pseudoxanthomonas sp. UTMC 1351 TaxID=2695853 RepID=UPI0034CF8075